MVRDERDKVFNPLAARLNLDPEFKILQAVIITQAVAMVDVLVRFEAAA
jgi:hypothetical protein